MPQSIPQLDLGPEIAELWDELSVAIQAVLRSGRFVLGPNVTAFETELAAYLGRRFAIGLNSGSDALLLGLRALGIGAGTEVITSPFSFVATAGAIAATGAQPVFADIELDTFNLDPKLLEERITPRTRAIVPVHLFGHPADMDPILEIASRHQLAVLEDACQAIGAEYHGRRCGALGDAAALSLYPSKNLGAYGDGGVLLTDDESLAARVREVGNRGLTRGHRAQRTGHSRLDELQAAILRVKLPHLERWNQRRRALAERYASKLAGTPELELPSQAPYATHVYHQYTVRVTAPPARDALAQALAREGIATAIHYSEPLHRLPAFAGETPPLPRAERAAREVLSLPMGPHLSEQQLDRVASSIRSALG